MKNDNVEISLKLLEQIAKYYEFPLAVFFLPKLKGTRRQYWQKKIEKLKKFLEEFLEEVK